MQRMCRNIDMVYDRMMNFLADAELDEMLEIHI